MQTLTPEMILYAGAFGVGLILSVYAMLNGTVRSGRTPDDIRPPIASFNTQVAGAAFAAFGAFGYLFTKYSQVGTISTAIMSLVAGAIGWAAMTTLMTRWALRGPLHDPHEEMEELQGSVATVVCAIETTQLGEIEYTFRGEHTISKARSLSGQRVEVGTEVIIDKIENNIADVELWSVVEQRL